MGPAPGRECLPLVVGECDLPWGRVLTSSSECDLPLGRECLPLVVGECDLPLGEGVLTSRGG